MHRQQIINAVPEQMSALNPGEGNFFGTSLAFRSRLNIATNNVRSRIHLKQAQPFTDCCDVELSKSNRWKFCAIVLRKVLT